MDEIKKMLIYAAIAVVLLLIAVTVFVAQAREIADDFFSSFDEPEEEQEKVESVKFTVDYLSEDAGFRTNLKYILTNFDPLGKFVHCAHTEYYYDDIHDSVYTIECDPIVFDLTSEDTDLSTEDVYNIFYDIFSDDEWKPDSFSDLTMIDIGPKKLDISANDMNFENNCRYDHIYADETLGRIYVYQDVTDITFNTPIDYKIMIKLYFQVNETADEFNPAMTICPNIVRS